MKTRTTRRTKVLAWLPTIVVLSVVTMTVAGISLVPGATAANTVAIGGTVTAGMSLPVDTSDGGCNAQSVEDFSAGTAIIADDTAGAGGNYCTLTFATNSAAGATLTINDSDTTTPFFCTGGGCGTAGSDSNASTTDPAGPFNLNTTDDSFGATVVSTGGTPAVTVGADFGGAVNATADPAVAQWDGVGTAASTACSTAGPTTVDNTCEIAFGVNGGGATQTAGTYSGTANITASAN